MHVELVKERCTLSAQSLETSAGQYWCFNFQNYTLGIYHFHNMTCR